MCMSRPRQSDLLNVQVSLNYDTLDGHFASLFASCQRVI